MISNERGLSEEQRMMRDAMRAFVDDFVTPFIRKNWQREWDMNPENRLPRELLEEAHKIGVRTLGIPEEFGGTPRRSQDRGADLRDDRRGNLARRLGPRRQAGADLEDLDAAAATSRRATCRKTGSRASSRTPTFLLAHCLTEPRGASDRWLPYDVPEAMMHTKAVLKGDKWVINGRKQFISNGYDAKLYVVYATTKPGAGMTKGTSSFLVPRDTPGLVGRALQRDAGRALHEQRRDRVRGLRGAEGPSAWWKTSRSPRRGRLLPSGQDHPGGEEPGHRHGGVRAHRRLRAELRAGRAHPDQAPGGRAPARRHGDQALPRCARC